MARHGNFSKDISGQIFGRLVAISRCPSAPGIAKWWCRCECGDTIQVTSYNLRHQKVTSCGCERVNRIAETRVCAHCKKMLPFRKFYRAKPGNQPTSYCIECAKIRKRSQHQKNPDRSRQRAAIATRRVREDVFNHYGNRCACCGEDGAIFLAIDHIGGGGSRHRKSLGAMGSNFYKWLRREKFPKGYQTLCSNCNWAKHANGGVCPHKVNDAVSALSLGV